MSSVHPILRRIEDDACGRAFTKGSTLEMYALCKHLLQSVHDGTSHACPLRGTCQSLVGFMLASHLPRIIPESSPSALTSITKADKLCPVLCVHLRHLLLVPRGV